MEDAVVKAARFMHENVGERIVLGDVADHVGYSPFHLARSFERYLGTPPGQFLAAHRFQKAKQLLLTSDARIIDVCFAVGFNSVGTFTRRFVAEVGINPTEFRRLPDILSDSPPQPIRMVGGVRGRGVVAGTTRLTPAASEALGDRVSIYVGLFRGRSARGIPAAGTMLGDTGNFLLTDVPAGHYWLLASALPSAVDPASQLVPKRTVGGVSPRPVHITAQAPTHFREVYLDAVPEWQTPVMVALPSLASEDAQDRRRRA